MWKRTVKTRVVDELSMREKLERVRAYIDEKKAEQVTAQKNSSQDSGNRIRYSLAEPIYDNEHIRDLTSFLSRAKQDSAMFDAPALKKTYHLWEKETAVRKTFSSEVIHHLKESRTRPSDFYKAAELDKRVYSSMKRDYCYSPSRVTAIKCCLALHLSFQEAEKLLKLAGYSLSPGLSKDLAIRFCLENGVYDIPSVNFMLEALGETPLA